MDLLEVCPYRHPLGNCRREQPHVPLSNSSLAATAVVPLEACQPELCNPPPLVPTAHSAASDTCLGVVQTLSNRPFSLARPSTRSQRGPWERLAIENTSETPRARGPLGPSGSRPSRRCSMSIELEGTLLSFSAEPLRPVHCPQPAEGPFLLISASIESSRLIGQTSRPVQPPSVVARS